MDPHDSRRMFRPPVGGNRIGPAAELERRGCERRRYDDRRHQQPPDEGLCHPQAKDYGYLRSNAQIIVSGGPYIEIPPASRNFICAPFYDPLIVFAPPRPGFAIAAAIRFGYIVPIGPAFRLWGWGSNRILWNTHTVILNNTPWVRVRGNRLTYVHPYAVPRWTAPRPPERHPVIIRTPREIDAARRGHPRIEDHHRHR